MVMLLARKQEWEPCQERKTGTHLTSEESHSSWAHKTLQGHEPLWGTSGWCTYQRTSQPPSHPLTQVHVELEKRAEESPGRKMHDTNRYLNIQGKTHQISHISVRILIYVDWKLLMGFYWTKKPPLRVCRYHLSYFYCLHLKLCNKMRSTYLFLYPLLVE